MSGKSIGGEAFTSNLAGMSKNQLYDIMCQMKTLIEQNQQQARQILVENPLLTRALFQAQIMLGMVQPPQVMPNIQQALSQQPQQTAQPGQPLNIQAAQSLPVPVGQQDQSSASQTQIQSRKLHQNHPAMPIPSGYVPPVTLQSQSMPSHALPTVQQTKGHLNAPVTSVTHSVSSQMHNIHLPNVSSQQQQSLQISGVPLMPMQPPLPQQLRPPSMPPYPHQLNSHMGSSLGFQHSGAPQSHISQSTYHSGAKPRPSIGPSFPLGQPPGPPLLNQPPPQSLYQAGGSQLVSDFGNQAGGSLQMERGTSWMTSPPENATGVQVGGPPPLPGQMGPNSQLPRPPQLTPDMEKALLQQVMSLTPEQINLLPPEQRHQVVQLQQMLH
ncbi:cleavage stimulating factor 64-like [Macadamia integrifolia]|uniref:cleavage stimulating factor 64-like n=1 Tax=Macadamia integrifolia TaxID=60698 RepID=UPI001C4E7C62|nr:cleavage stimulating factor 64-like [Macadamia integrifolia]